MTNSRHAYLLNSVFVGGLLLLLLNDHVFKAAYGNALTGKLSDFAGVLILPLFLRFVTGRSTVFCLGLTVCFFTWWKSPLSQPAIDLINGFGALHLVRMVDYTDLLAFLILPLSWRVLEQPQGFLLRLPAARQLAGYALLPLTLVAFAATSIDNDLEPDSTITTCCVSPPVNFSDGTSRIYVPTAFSPDGDGVSDFFFPILDSNIIRLDLMEVRSNQDFSTVFQADAITDFANFMGWDGMVGDSIPAASFTFNIFVTFSDSITRGFSGTVCSLPCEAISGQPVPELLDSCAFSTQYDPVIGFDPSTQSFFDGSCF